MAMIILQFILTGIFYVWLFLVLWLLWRVWRTSSAHIHHMELLLVDVAQKNTEATKITAEAVQHLAKKATAD